jgi:hypothetical protein
LELADDGVVAIIVLDDEGRLSDPADEDGLSEPADDTECPPAAKAVEISRSCNDRMPPSSFSPKLSLKL